MRIRIFFTALLAVGILAACAEIEATELFKKANRCADAAASSRAAKITFDRLWLGDGTDTADKLRDTAPITPEERNAFAEFQDKIA